MRSVDTASLGMLWKLEKESVELGYGVKFETD